ncbi:hypothetical protein GHT06_010476 [Daphnia sinensis]|uniref:Uncharacterized protein n=1 Tax=Daphnia sinensis TaxID=1820382 RepID=A0AAD5L0I9_9CRUS|nr:hypothetical protein GHT06_010476 [Daphnia sinensis]
MPTAFLSLLMLVLAPLMVSGRPADSVDTIFSGSNQMMFPSYVPWVQQPDYGLYQLVYGESRGNNPSVKGDGLQLNSPTQLRGNLMCILFPNKACFPVQGVSPTNSNRIPWMLAPLMAFLQQPSQSTSTSSLPG